MKNLYGKLSYINTEHWAVFLQTFLGVYPNLWQGWIGNLTYCSRWADTLWADTGLFVFWPITGPSCRDSSPLICVVFLQPCKYFEILQVYNQEINRGQRRDTRINTLVEKYCTGTASSLFTMLELLNKILNIEFGMEVYMNVSQTSSEKFQ